MVLEYLTDTSASGGVFPTDVLSSDETRTAIESLAYAKFSMITGWKWAWKKPGEEWQKDIAKGLDLSKKGNEWLADNNYHVDAFNSRFGQTIGQDGIAQFRLFSFGKIDKKKGPMVVYDSGSPDKLYRNRLMLEFLSTGVVFGSKMIAVVGGMLGKAYKQFVERPADNAKFWEARLSAHLEQRTAVTGQSFETELRVLDHQRVNPLSLSRQKTFELVRSRKEKLGLGN